MIWWDIFLFVTYALVVYWVLSNAIASLDKRAKVALNKARIGDDLKARGLTEVVKFDFAFEKIYALADSIKVLKISVKNTSSHTLYINWDNSVLTDLGGRSRRVIRLSPDKSPDLVRAQVWSMIPAKQSLKEVITAEDVLGRASETEPLVPTGMIVPIRKPRKKNEPEHVGPLSFFLCIWLVVQQNTDDTGTQEFQYLIPIEFIITRCPWTDALPW